MKNEIAEIAKLLKPKPKPQPRNPELISLEEHYERVATEATKKLEQGYNYGLGTNGEWGWFTPFGGLTPRNVKGSTERD
jgi:hypothetical protein